MNPLPQVVAGLVAALRAAPALGGVRVDDGPPVRALDARDVIGVGLGVDGGDSATATLGRTLGYRVEVMDVSCAIECWSGDAQHIPERRARAGVLLDGVHAVLQADPTLGGAAETSEVVRWGYAPFSGKDGAGVLINFAVRVQSYRLR